MPQTLNYTVGESAVKRNDIIGGVAVTGVERKEKYTYIVLDEVNGKGAVKKLRIEHDGLVTVTRTEPTPEEKLAEEWEYVARSAMRTAQNAIAAVNDAAAKIVDESHYRHEHQHWALGQYLQATAERDIWNAVLFQTGRPFQKDSDTPATIVDAVVSVAAEYREALISNRYRGESTSGISNVGEAYMQKAASHFLREYIVLSAERVVAKMVKVQS